MGVHLLMKVNQQLLFLLQVWKFLQANIIQVTWLISNHFNPFTPNPRVNSVHAEHKNCITAMLQDTWQPRIYSTEIDIKIYFFITSKIWMKTWRLHWEVKRLFGSHGLLATLFGHHIHVTYVKTTILFTDDYCTLSRNMLKNSHSQNLARELENTKMYEYL